MFDITLGYSAQSGLSSSTATDNAKKINIYNNLAQVLVGHDATGSILEFDEDGDILAGGTKLREIIVINYARLLYKDEIKKSSYFFEWGLDAHATPMDTRASASDAGAVNDFRVNSPTGEYGILSSSASGSVGLLFYQAGVVVLTASIFPQSTDMDGAGSTIDDILVSSSISSSANEVRRRFYDNSFNNTTELQSTIYFCRLNNNEFNYSANPTYVSGSKINVKNNQLDAPVSYVTTVGLYSSDNELLAVAKTSEPLRKDPTSEINLRVRIDF